MLCDVANEGMWSFLISFANRHPLMVIGVGLILLSSISNLSTKKVKVKTNYHMSLWFFLAGLGCMGLDLWQSNSLPIKNKAATKTPLNIEQVSTDLKRKMENYHEALQTRDYDRISPFYPNVLDSYFGEDKVTFAHVWRRMKQDWKKMANENVEVLWNTWRYRHEEETGRHIVSFSFKHAYQTTDKQPKEMAEEKKVEYSFDRNYKIYRVDKSTIN